MDVAYIPIIVHMLSFLDNLNDIESKCYRDTNPILGYYQNI